LLDRSNDSVIIAGDGSWTRYSLPIESGAIGSGERKFICIWAKGQVGSIRFDLCSEGTPDAHRREWYIDVNQDDTSFTRKYYFDNDNWWPDPSLGDGVNYGSGDTVKMGLVGASASYLLLEMDSTELVGLNDTLDNYADSVSTDTLYAVVSQMTGITTQDVMVRPMLLSHNDDESDWEDRTSSLTWNTEGGRGAGTDYDNSMSWTYDLDDTTSAGNLDISIDGHGDSVITGDVTYMWGYMLEVVSPGANDNITLRSSDEPGTASDPYRQLVMWWVTESGLEDPSVGVTTDTTDYAPHTLLYWTTATGATQNRHGADRHGAMRH
jgi:hypothetical protein